MKGELASKSHVALLINKTKQKPEGKQPTLIPCCFSHCPRCLFFVTIVFGTRDSSGLILFLATLQPFVIVHHDSQCLQAGAMFFTGILNCGLANLNPGPHVLWNDQNTGWLVSGAQEQTHAMSSGRRSGRCALF